MEGGAGGAGAAPMDEDGSEEPAEHDGCGCAVPLHEIRVVDEQGAPLPDRRQGRLHFRGPSAFKGYYRNPEATARVKLADGWVDTGDLAYADDEGYIRINGRSKDVLIRGGENVPVVEIEATAVHEAGHVGPGRGDRKP